MVCRRCPWHHRRGPAGPTTRCLAVLDSVWRSSKPSSYGEIREMLQAERAEQVRKAAAEAAAPVSEESAEKNRRHLWFTQPEVPTAGAPLAMYINAKRSEALQGCSSLRLMMGFNRWSLREHRVELDMARAQLPGAVDGDDWWCVTVPEVPELAKQADFVFCADGERWENNAEKDFKHAVLLGPSADEGSVQVHELPGPDPSQNITIRVWLPPGYDPENAPASGYPVVYLNDGQNLFDGKLAFGGVCWEAGAAATYLIASGKLPPFIIVGIDNRGVDRGWDYTPYPCGAGREGFRGDAANWPGGGVWFYLQWLVESVLPFAENTYRCSTSPQRRAFGGSSLGGICGLCCAMKYHDVFGSILAESPSFWIKEGQFLEDMRQYSGPWPARLFMAMGTQEYSGTRPKKMPKFDKWMADYAEEGRAILESKGLADGSRLMYVLEERAAHNEADWARRLPGALEYLLGNTWDC